MAVRTSAVAVLEAVVVRLIMIGTLLVDMFMPVVVMVVGGRRRQVPRPS